MQSTTRRLISWLILSSFRTGPRPPAPALTTNCSHGPVAGHFRSAVYSCFITDNRPQRAMATATQYLGLPPPHCGRWGRKARIHEWAETWTPRKTRLRLTGVVAVDRRPAEHSDGGPDLHGIEKRNGIMFWHAYAAVRGRITRQISGVHSVSAVESHKVMHRR